MMHHKVLIVLAALFGLYQLIVVKNKFSRLILALQVAGIAITFLPMPGAMISGFTVFILAGILASVYPFSGQGASSGKRGLILLIALPVVITNIFAISKLPFTGMLSFSMIVPVIACLYIVFAKLKDYRNEIGFLCVLAIDAAIKILMAVEWASFS